VLTLCGHGEISVRKSTFQTSLRSGTHRYLYVDREANKGKSIEERLELVVIPRCRFRIIGRYAFWRKLPVHSSAQHNVDETCYGMIKMGISGESKDSKALRQ
jgi:hypothetical protein